MEQGSSEWLEQRIKNLTKKISKSYYEIAQVKPFASPVEWAGKNINFEHDVSAEHQYFDINLTPYINDPLEEWSFNTIKEVTVMAPEQTGKTLAWLIGLLWSFEYKPCLSLIVYPSDDLGVKINKEKLEPLMRSIPKMRAELAMPRSQKRDCYHFSNLKCYFAGAGSRVTSQSAKIRIGDEIDDWTEHENKITNVEDLRKRARAFSESMFFKVCTPTEKDGAIWKEFQESSQGYWFLRCQKCKNLTMRSCDIHNLQWELDNYGDIIGDSIRLICPKCKNEHTENERKELNVNGGYIHNYPERKNHHPGYQWGALASQLNYFRWESIAQKQMKSGKSGNKKDQTFFYNSIRGLPFVPQKHNETEREAIFYHCTDYLPPKNEIENVFFSADTQDTGWYWIVRAIDIHSNRYLLGYGFVETLQELEERMYAEYLGIEPIMGIIDQGGHRTKEVERFVESHHKLFMYKGDSRRSNRYNLSGDIEDLILAKARIFQADLLYYLYSQKNTENNYMFLPNKNNLSDEYVEHITALKPNNSMKEGHYYYNYIHEGRRHDFFDCEKMMLVLMEFAIDVLAEDYWRVGKMDLLSVDEETTETTDKPTPAHESWMAGYSL